MVDKLTPLYNTLLTIETKGDSTKAMADCLRYLERVIAEEKQKKVEPVKEEA